MGPFRKIAEYVTGTPQATSVGRLATPAGWAAGGSTVSAALTPLSEQGTGQPLYAALDSRRIKSAESKARALVKNVR